MEHHESQMKKQSTSWSDKERLKYYLRLYRSGDAVRTISLLKTSLDKGDARLTEFAHLLVCVCAEQGEFLHERFTGEASIRTIQARTRVAQMDSRYEKLVPKAERLRAQPPFDSMTRWTTPVARRVVEGLSTDEWDALTAQKGGTLPILRTKNAVDERVRRFAKFLRNRQPRRGRAVESDVQVDAVTMGILNRHLPSIGGFVSRRPASQDV
jgi:hypothetical protein